MSIIQTLIDEDALVLYLDLRAGHMQDLSGNGNHGVPTDVTWQGGGVHFGTTGKIVVADSPELQGVTGALVVLMEPLPLQTSWSRLLGKKDAGGQMYEWVMAATPYVGITDGVPVTRTSGISIIGARSVGINFTNGGTPDGYVNGLFSGAYSGTVTIGANDADVTIGAPYTAGSRFPGVMFAVLIFSRPLTATEMAQVYSELESLTWPSKGKSQAVGSYGLELMVDGDQEAVGVGAWSVSNGVLTKEIGNVLGGNQILRNTKNGASTASAYQAIAVIGNRYRATGWARGDGGGNTIPRVSDGTNIVWIGTNSTVWQYFDIIFVATTTSPLFHTANGGAGEWTEFDNISITEIDKDKTQFKTDWGAKVVTGVTAGQIPGTPLMVDSGTWDVNIETVDGEECKVLECTSAGKVYLDMNEAIGDPTQNAQGTFRWWLSKGAATAPLVHFISPDSTGSSGYRLGSNSDEVVQVVETGVEIKFSSAASYILASTFYEYKVTVSSTGVFTAYIDDVEIVEDSGDNPFTDTTTTTSYYVVIELDGGDEICLADKKGGHCIQKQQGVN